MELLREHAREGVGRAVGVPGQVARAVRRRVAEQCPPVVLDPVDSPLVFFQAEDGIRDTSVTGVQTCALPIYARCVSCHSTGTPMRLQPLAPGSATWSEEESRKNFDVIRLRIVPGNPGASKLLRHPLEEQAGGDNTHDGGKHWKSQEDPEWQTLAAWVRGQTVGGTSAPTGKVRIIQTNAAGDNVSIIDPLTNKVVGEITGIEVNHGAAAAPDGSRS